jgi:xylan 1,4-beta-xylosidase
MNHIIDGLSTDEIEFTRKLERMSHLKISNPVLPGFDADPSMIRVGDTYYIANSTFEWFPGVRLHESKDMVHWKLLPSPLNSTSMVDMKGNPASGGVWAPDLSYADGKFWLVFSDVKVVEGAFKDTVNYLTTADSILGPWSTPIRLGGMGFDASLFHDDDGRKYLVQQTWDHRDYKHPFHGITLTEFDAATGKLVPATRRTIWNGDEVKLVEGPHLYKINGYYYLFAAEGGTVFTHREVVARSSSLSEMSFEASPLNPFITNFDTPDSYLQKQGHGALVNTPSGEWYYASLCARPWHHENESATDPRGWSPLGRETSIQKVDWTEDGWPYIVGGHGGERFVDAPVDAIETSAPADNSQIDEFESDTLDPNWNTLRVPFTSAMGSVGGGQLRLVGQGSLCNPFEFSLVARRWQAFDFDAQVKVEFNPDTYQAMAGLTNYYNNDNWSWAFVSYDEVRGVRVIDVAQNDRNVYTSFLQNAAIEVPQDADVWLRVQVRTQSYSYSYSFDGVNWEEIPVQLDAAKLSDEYILADYGGFFTGAFVGLACVDYSGFGATAAFEHFAYRELEHERPEDRE